jgi:predicted RNA-binding Zn ribbon-like protein
VIRVTWEWLGQGPALDLADTVTIEDGVETDLIDSPAEYARWASVEASYLPHSSARVLMRARLQLLDVRSAVRDLLGAVSAGHRPPKNAAELLNAASRSAPTWRELDPVKLSIRDKTSADEIGEVVAAYARSAMDLVATEGDRLRRCPAPSCGMFYVRSRPQQRWCSTQCGTRARVASHYRRRRQTR